MKKINVIETFSGIGAQHQALENLKKYIDYEVVGTSDWDVYAVQSYASIHYKEELKKEPDPTFEQLENFIEDFKKTGSFSIDGKRPFESYGRISREQYINWYKAFKVTKNIGSVVNSFERVKNLIETLGEKIDLLTYSFPCQDLSSAGNFHGFNEGIKEHTRSGLLYEIEALIKKLRKVKLEKNKISKSDKSDNLLPKFLLLENVVNLVQVQHKQDFDNWLNELQKMGYKTIWGIVNSNDFGLLQARRRTFALSIYDPENKLDWDSSIRSDLNDELTKIYETKEFRPKQKQEHIKVFDFDNIHKEESWLCQIKDTPSRNKMINLGKDINKDYKGKISTITTKQDRWPNPGSIYSGNIRKPDSKGTPYTDRRFFTPRECYKLMGFEDVHYERAKEQMEKNCVSQVAAREKLYKQAGNSIAINSLEMIFYYMSKLDKEIK